MTGTSAGLTGRRALLAGVLVLALAERLAGAGARLTGDEGYTWLVSSAPSASAFLGHLANFENTPPLFYLLAAPLSDGGPALLRLPSVLAGTAAVGVLYAIVRPLLGTPTALLCALALAILPEQAAFSDDARGFMLCEVALLVALWAAVRLAGGAPRRWWWLWGGGAVAALYSEYDAALFLGALLVALLALGRPARRDTLVFGLAPALAFIPWTGELVRSIGQVDHTKAWPFAPRVSPAAVRDVLVPEFLGRFGRMSSPAARNAELAGLVAVLAAAGTYLLRRDRAHTGAWWLIIGGGLGTVAAHVLSPALGGPALLAERYLVVVAPLGVIVVAGAIARSSHARWALPAAAVALAPLAGVLLANRARGDSQPDPARYRMLVTSGGTRTVITNSAAILYYLDGQHPIFAPTGITPALERACATPSRLPLAIIDDTEIGHPISGPGTTTTVGALTVRLVRFPEGPVAGPQRCVSTGL